MVSGHQGKKACEINCYENICQKDRQKQLHIREKESDVEMPGQGRILYRPFFGFCEEPGDDGLMMVS